MPTSFPTRAALAAVVTAAFAVLPATGASADSIAYVKKGDVWLATPDGTRQVQVTHSGRYSYVSQADDGTMIALAPGERLHRLSRTGDVLADFPTYVSDGAPQSGPVNKFHGPFAPEISPDGRLVAFEWFNDSYDNGNSSGCNPSSQPPCYVLNSSQGVGITRSDRFTGYEAYGLLTGWIGPHWMSNDKLLRSYSNGVMNEDAVFNDIGPGKGDKAMDRWFYDETGVGLYEVELSRDRKVVAAIAGQNDEQLRVYRPLVEPYGAPDPNMGPFAHNDPIVEGCFWLGDPIGGKFESLSLAPDGRHIAYGVGNGIWVADIPDLSAGCAMPTENKLRIPGGRFPHWGPADVPNIPGGLRLVMPRRARTAAVISKGLRIQARVATTGRLTAVLRGGGKVLGRGSSTARPGVAAVTVRLSSAGTRFMRARSSVRATATLTFRPARGGVKRGVATVTLAR
jgi:hypothetical protein